MQARETEPQYPRRLAKIADLAAHDGGTEGVRQYLASLRRSFSAADAFAVEVLDMLYVVAKHNGDRLSAVIAEAAIDVIESCGTVVKDGSTDGKVEIEVPEWLSNKRDEKPQVNPEPVKKTEQVKPKSLEVPHNKKEVAEVKPKQDKVSIPKDKPVPAKSAPFTKKEQVEPPKQSKQQAPAKTTESAKDDDDWLTESEEEEQVDDPPNDLPTVNHDHDNEDRPFYFYDTEEPMPDDPVKEQFIENLLHENADLLEKTRLNRKKRRLLLRALRMADNPTRKDIKKILKHVIAEEATEEEREKRRLKRDKWQEKQKEKEEETKRQNRLKYEPYTPKFDINEYEEDYLSLNDIAGKDYQFFYLTGPSPSALKEAAVNAVDNLMKKQMLGFNIHHSKVHGRSKLAFIEITSENKGFIFDVKSAVDEQVVLPLLQPLLESNFIWKVGYNLNQAMEILSESDFGSNLRFKKMASIEDVLFPNKTATILNIARICYRYFGRMLSPEKMKTLCEKDKLDLQEKKILMVNAVAVLRMSSGLYVPDLSKAQLPRTADQLRRLAINTDWTFVLDVTCNCCSVILTQLGFKHLQLKDATYEEMRQHAQAPKSVLVTSDAYIATSPDFENVLLYQGKADFIHAFSKEPTN